jgi:hypothetical protein
MTQYRVRKVEGQTSIPEGDDISHYFTKCRVCEKYIPLEEPADLLDVYEYNQEEKFTYRKTLGIVCSKECIEMAILQQI